MEANEEKTVDSNELRDLLRKARLFIECSPLKKVEANFGCLDRDKICADIDVALAKPRRNCDRFNSGDVKKDADDALHAYLNEGAIGYRAAAEYLLSPCKEGGSDDA